MQQLTLNLSHLKDNAKDPFNYSILYFRKDLSTGSYWRKDPNNVEADLLRMGIKKNQIDLIIGDIFSFYFKELID